MEFAAWRSECSVVRYGWFGCANILDDMRVAAVLYASQGKRWDKRTVNEGMTLESQLSSDGK